VQAPPQRQRELELVVSLGQSHLVAKAILTAARFPVLQGVSQEHVQPEVAPSWQQRSSNRQGPPAWVLGAMTAPEPRVMQTGRLLQVLEAPLLVPAQALPAQPPYEAAPAVKPVAVVVSWLGRALLPRVH